MNKNKMIEQLANGETVTFEHNGYQHQIGSDFINPHRDEMSNKQRLQWAIEMTNRVFEHFGLEDDSDSTQQDSKIIQFPSSDSL